MAKPGAQRAYAHFDSDKGSVVLFYEQYQPPAFKTSKLVWVESETGPGATDPMAKWTWTRPTVALVPTLPWEKVGTQRVGNPFVSFHRGSSKWRLHYSASSVHLADSDIDEPLHLGLAQVAASV